ncbi:MAG: hypothetical protein HY898_31320 [Deltaproteobacteria bacterium]|nr:hypothetical protein [Deltaproteobacteria bacterium]
MKSGSAAVIVASVAWTTVPEAATAVSVPLSCTRGPSNQRAELLVTIPASVEAGSTFTARFDGKNSGPISHTGLNYIHEMTTELLVPTGATYVEGSAHIIPNTGTANVRAGARVTKQGNTITLFLPAHVEDGSNYTPPSFEFQVKVTAAAGAKVAQRFSQYRVTANAIIVGDVHTVCDPTPKPYTVGTTNVVAAPAQP